MSETMNYWLYISRTLNAYREKLIGYKNLRVKVKENWNFLRKRLQKQKSSLLGEQWQ